MADHTETAFSSSFHQEKLNQAYNQLDSLSFLFLEEPMGLPEGDWDHKAAGDVLIGLIDRLKYRAVNGEWPVS